MKREWKPGDVALVGPIGRTMEIAIVHSRRQAGGALEFRYLRGGFDMVDDLADGWTARPLVVIDAEDRDQVERLADLNERHTPNGSVSPTDSTNAMQAALREFANPTPPKPEEPMGLGAVVATEADGDFIRVSCELLNPWLNAPTSAHCPWDRVAAVRVLSEGVTA